MHVPCIYSSYKPPPGQVYLAQFLLMVGTYVGTNNVNTRLVYFSVGVLIFLSKQQDGSAVSLSILKTLARNKKYILFPSPSLFFPFSLFPFSLFFLSLSLLFCSYFFFSYTCLLLLCMSESKWGTPTHARMHARGGNRCKNVQS